MIKRAKAKIQPKIAPETYTRWWNLGFDILIFFSVISLTYEIKCEFIDFCPLVQQFNNNDLI